MTAPTTQFLADLAEDAAELAKPKEVAPGDMAHLMALAEEFKTLRLELDRLEAEKKQVNERLTLLKTRDLPDEMIRLGLVGPDGKGSFTLASGGRIHLKTDAHVSVPEEVRQKLVNWLRRHGFKDLVRPTVSPQTLKAFVKEQRAAGAKIPPMIVTFDETTAVFTKGKDQA